MGRVALVVVVTAAAIGFALRPSLAGSGTMWLALAVPYLALAAFALYKLWDDGTLVDRLQPRWGDLSIGAITFMLLMLGSWAARSVLAPAGTPAAGWIVRIYLQMGSADILQRSALETLALLGLPVLEEIVWRGLVLDSLKEKLGKRLGPPAAALLYAACALPTLFTLADPNAGPNPLLCVAALGCGIVWSYTASIMGRLTPVIISHMAFTYFSAVQFRLPGM